MNMFGSFAMASLVALGLGTASLAQSWDMPVRSNERNYMTQSIAQFADDVAEATEGGLKIVLHPEDALIRQPDVKGAVQTGQVPIGEYLMSLHSNENPVFGVDSIPFLSDDFESNRKLLDAARPVIEEELAKQNLKLLFVTPWPPQGVYTRNAIDSVEDLAGVKFRAYNPITARLAELMGALPVTVQQAEVPQAFSTGVIEAMITSPATGVDTQAWDFVEHYYDTRAFIPWNIIVVNDQMFQSLDSETQEAVMQAAAAADARGWELAPAETDKLVGTLAENGMEIHEPGPELQQELQAIGATLVDEWAATAGEQGQKILDAYGYEG